MKSRGVRSSQAGGPNITTPLLVTTSQTFSPNAYPFKYKLYLWGAGSNSEQASQSIGANNVTTLFGGAGGSGKFYISASTETLTSGSLTFAIGASAASTGKSLGGNTTVTRNDNAVVVGAYNTAYTLPSGQGAGNGGSGGGASGGQIFNNANGSLNSSFSAGGGGINGGTGLGGNGGSGGNGDASSGNQTGNDSRIASGGNGAFQSGNANVFFGNNAPSHAGIVISGTTYLAGTSYSRGGDGSRTVGVFTPGGTGVAILEPIA